MRGGAVLTNLFEYSTEEKVIGTFLGKPLYRKVIQTNMTERNVTYPLNSLGLQDIKYVIKLYSVCQGEPIEQDYFCNMTTDVLRTLINPNGLIISLGSEWPAKPCLIYTFIEYTKTTD